MLEDRFKFMFEVKSEFKSFAPVLRGGELDLVH